MSTPKPNDKVQLSRDLPIAGNPTVTVLDTLVTTPKLPKGTKGVVRATDAEGMTVSLDVQSLGGDFRITLSKSPYGNTFESQTSPNKRFVFKQTVKVDSKIKVVTRNVQLTEIPVGTTATGTLTPSGQVALKIVRPGKPVPVEIEMSMIHLSMVTTGG